MLLNFLFAQIVDFFFLLWRCNPTRVMAFSFLRFLDDTQRRTTVGRTPLDEWSALRRDLCLTTHNTHNRQTFMPPVEFEPTISVGERPQTYALDRATTGTGILAITFSNKTCIFLRNKYSQVKTQLVLWIFILFKVTRWQHVSSSITRPSSGHK